MRIVTVVGARPQFIKAAALSRAISANGDAIQEQILHTGQHFDAAMSDQFFAELGIPAPAFHLGIGGGSHGANTGRMLEAIEKVLLEQRPDALLVYGDTDSTLAGGLAGSKIKIPVVHWRLVCALLTGISRRSKTGFLSIIWLSCALLPPMLR